MNDTALRKPTARRVVGMVAGIVIIALGIALFKQSHLGNDSISALNMRLAELLGISLILDGVLNISTVLTAVKIINNQYKATARESVGKSIDDLG